MPGTTPAASGQKVNAPFKHESGYWWAYASDYPDPKIQPLTISDDSIGLGIRPWKHVSCKLCRKSWFDCKCKRYQPKVS